MVRTFEAIRTGKLQVTVNFQEGDEASAKILAGMEDKFLFMSFTSWKEYRARTVFALTMAALTGVFIGGVLSNLFHH